MKQIVPVTSAGDQDVHLVMFHVYSVASKEQHMDAGSEALQYMHALTEHAAVL